MPPSTSGVEMQPLARSNSQRGSQAHLQITKVKSGTKSFDKEGRGQLLQLYREGRHKVSLPSSRVWCLQFAVSGGWLAVQALAIITDMVILTFTFKCSDLSEDERANNYACQSSSDGAFYVISICTTVLYVIDISLRIYGFGRVVFFRSITNWFDLLVVIVSGFGSIDPETEFLGGASFFKVARFVKLFRLGRTAALMKACCGCMRRVTGENKRRFVSPEHDLDLDLVYITPWLIGMSVPAAGCMTRFYRNPLPEVVRFFETFHEGKYFIANMCPELPYPVSDFKTGHVECFDIQDHTPPLFSETVSFLRDAQVFLQKDEERVVAVHCRGGKGRTGSFCCAMLLYNKEAEDAEDALNFFCLMRTDTDQTGKAKTQGVETPSQMRYVEYIDRHLREEQAYTPHAVDPPEPVRLLLSKFEVKNAWKGPIPDDLLVAVHDMEQRRVVHWARGAGGVWHLPEVGVLADTRISVFGRGDVPPEEDLLEVRRREAEKAHDTGKRVLAGKEHGCLFYFIFHTSFVEGNDLQLSMSMVDNAAKKKDGKLLYDLSGIVKLSFSVLPVP